MIINNNLSYMLYKQDYQPDCAAEYLKSKGVKIDNA